MVNANYQKRFNILLIVTFISAVVWSMELVLIQAEDNCYCLTVSFLDVGQGDAIFITTPEGIELLIDGGPDGGVMRELGKLKTTFNNEIELVIATHPDLDHIGGLVEVFERYDVEAFIETTNINPTPTSAALATVSEAELGAHHFASAGEIIKLGQSVFLQILSPIGDETDWESNNASIVIRVVFKDTAFMLTGDVPSSIENNLVSLYGEQLKSDVLKLGHHGSKTSTSEEFLLAVQPEWAVVSAGEKNRYGHPHAEVMKRVFDQDIETFYTSDGTITFVSDGEKVWQE